MFFIVDVRLPVFLTDAGGIREMPTDLRFWLLVKDTRLETVFQVMNNPFYIT